MVAHTTKDETLRCVAAPTGVLLPSWTPSEVQAEASKPSPLPERFYLGGVESNIRGFDLRGIGPSEPRRRSGSSTSTSSSSAAGGDGPFSDSRAVMRDSLGGDIFSNVYAGLMLRLPGQVGDLGAHAHVFANGGSSVLLGGGSTAAAAAVPAAGSSGSSSGSSGVLTALGERLRGGLQQMGSTYRWSAGESWIQGAVAGGFLAGGVR
jgi:outer membrane protein assembly factor BamA